MLSATVTSLDVEWQKNMVDEKDELLEYHEILMATGIKWVKICKINDSYFKIFVSINKVGYSFARVNLY